MTIDTIKKYHEILVAEMMMIIEEPRSIAHGLTQAKIKY